MKRWLILGNLLLLPLGLFAIADEDGGSNAGSSDQQTAAVVAPKIITKTLLHIASLYAILEAHKRLM